ncbi:MAG: MOSC domain-containing protein [Gemmatimonadetes bacterium]|nr:MAG: MOSC domain-containing protein [Gemmatimonadota bacterium]
MMFLSEIYIYPVKSMGAIRPNRAVVTDRGLQYDRRWMLIDPSGMFLTQEKSPRLAQIQPEITATELILTAPHQSPLHLPLRQSAPATETVRIWESTCQAVPVSPEADRWLSAFLRTECRLVYMPDETRRRVDPEYALNPQNIVSFADGYPFLLISSASLADLNARLTTPVPMSRFRPNLVVSGSEPFAEDQWRRLHINGIPFQAVKPCARCRITTVNPQTGTHGKEPLKTLATYRRRNGKIYFGMNLIHEGEGYISVGDAVEMLPEPFLEA